MKKIIQFLLPALLVCCWSCSEGEDSPSNEYATIEISTHRLTIDEDGGQKTFSFTSNAEWTTDVVSDGKWIKVFPTNGGKGKNILTVTTQYNDTHEERNANIIIASGKTSKSIAIIQTNYGETTRKTQIEALKKLYESTNGNNWTNNNNWLSDNPLNNWHGITTDKNGLVTGINLGNNNLKGYLPKEIGVFHHLEDLYLYKNQLEGELPDEIGQLTKLKRLALYMNSLSGTIPSTIGNLSALRSIELSICQFEGTIPECIGNLKELADIKLSNNHFTGKIPSSIFQLPQLQILELNNCQLEGDIPNEIVNLKEAWLIKLNNNPDLTGLPQNNSILELPCWQYNWWNMIGNTGIKVPIEEGLIPGPSIKVKDLNGNAIVSKDEYSNNKYTILVQWNPRDSQTQNFIPNIVPIYQKYSQKGINIIGWCNDDDISEEQLKSYIKENNIPWRNFKSYIGNAVSDNFSEYPGGAYGLTVHVVNSDNRVVFSSLVSDVNTLPDFLEEAFAE